MTNGNETATGYLSEASKKKFTLTAGILGAAFLIGQFLLPMLLMFGLMAGEITDFGTDDTLYAYPQRSEVLDDTLYYVVRRSSLGPEGLPAAIKQLDLDLTQPPVETIQMQDTGVSLIASDGRLWVFSKNEISYLKNGELIKATQGTELAEFSRPFLYQGRPAVLERWPTSLVLATYWDEGWQRGPSLELIMPDPDCRCGFSWVHAIADDSGLHVFLELGSTLYYGLWDPASDVEVNWELVGSAGRSWWPLFDNGRAVVFTLTPRDQDGEFVGLRQHETGWEEFFRGGYAPDSEISVYPLSDPGSFLVLAGSGYNSRIKATIVRGAEITNELVIDEEIDELGEKPVDDFGRTMYLIMGVQYGATFLLPMLLAVILSILMKRHRIATVRTEDGEASHASLTRRAIAQFIDALVMAAPAVLGIWFASTDFWTPDWYLAEGFWESVGSITPILGGLTASFLMFFVFAYTEGKRGVTPGKWATRIRVLGTDLQPCGFSRALVRNLLKVIDGFFNFMVGIMVVALSENWQRVGDMAARTVVVNSPLPTPNPVESE